MSDPLLLRVAQAAELLGIPERTVYLWCQDGRLPVVRVGRVVRIPRHALEEWIARNTQPARRVG